MGKKEILFDLLYRHNDIQSILQISHKNELTDVLEEWNNSILRPYLRQYVVTDDLSNIKNKFDLVIKEGTPSKELVEKMRSLSRKYILIIQPKLLSHKFILMDKTIEVV